MLKEETFPRSASAVGARSVQGGAVNQKLGRVSKEETFLRSARISANASARISAGASVGIGASAGISASASARISADASARISASASCLSASASARRIRCQCQLPISWLEEVYDM